MESDDAVEWLTALAGERLASALGDLTQLFAPLTRDDVRSLTKDDFVGGFWPDQRIAATALFNRVQAHMRVAADGTRSRVERLLGKPAATGDTFALRVVLRADCPPVLWTCGEREGAWTVRDDIGRVYQSRDGVRPSGSLWTGDRHVFFWCSAENEHTLRIHIHVPLSALYPVIGEVWKSIGTAAWEPGTLGVNEVYFRIVDEFNNE